LLFINTGVNKKAIAALQERELAASGGMFMPDHSSRENLRNGRS
jgi:hypothetical protein